MVLLIDNVLLSGIFNCIVHTSNLKTDFYTEKNSHPHPSIRLAYILEFIIVVINQINGCKPLNTKQVLLDTFAIAKFQVTSEAGIEHFIKISKENITEIKRYVDKLTNEAKKNKKLSINW